MSEIHRSPDTAALARAAAERFVAVVVDAQKTRGSAFVVLTGGGTGVATLKAVKDLGGDIDWSAVDVFFGDERFLPEGDSERNYVQAKDALLDHVGVDEARVHVMAPSDSPLGDDVDAAAVAYLQAVAAFGGTDGPVFDVHLLGMGPDSHINSLFPHSDAVREDSSLVLAVTDSPKPPPVRITLTLPAVNRSRHVWFLVSGEGKADAVAACVGGADPIEHPAAGAHGTESTVWFLDEGSASRL
ncbi:6-phosphogluconolactonase [Rhodococcus sp. Leaf7]|uniref:6-phosphogluconolactonase n=1 Tax=unclassified Rhodococcus (in: high G+C Gram-positive bacteria) TaxID=192944 RepID=UPI0006FEB1DE|nr:MULTISPECIES: 6-phosphogluconolactonase [unclassified Rhodococcus (in: high G+C Gram-positive bacteria)]KQU02995.1 6-phosphogluconolactonase [Rhodococcus sp. Leaf7]KQU38794.1 6-phosphogluconolactonase [Rhodococcus sp. Leaf247]